MRSFAIFVLALGLIAAAARADDAAARLPAGAPQPASFQCDFESADTLPAGWKAQGHVAIDSQDAFKGKRSLLLTYVLGDPGNTCAAVGPDFPVQPGRWAVSLAAKSDLKSPDSSFDGIAELEVLDNAGKTLDRITLADLYGQHNWQPVRKEVELAQGAAAARFHVRINKPAGRFWVDELSAAYLGAVPVKDNRIDRIVFSTAQMGNLLFPEDKRTVSVRVEATKPLDDTQKELTYTVRDYWGAECAAPAAVALGTPRRDGKRYIYEAAIDLAATPLEIGRYYELHAQVARAGDEPFHNYTSLAILPKAVTKQYKAEEIPFTNRNWDSRIGEFFYLADRLGIRIAPSANVELCTKLGMGTMIGVGIGAIEHHSPGWEKITDNTLRQEVRNSIAKNGKLRPLLLTLGNEPPVIEDYLPANVAAYKAVYEEVKRVDPSITVISTSVGPAEPFFKAGFHKYCDVVDFHGYSDWQEIRAAFQEYDRLFAKYGGRKPIWSTEIGLNSQGLARQTVAASMVKKLTSFFACGGGNVCWFDLGYPDPDVKLAEDSTSAHNVFDCRYCRYCPKLDAIAYYNMINGICVKKPVAEKVYGPDTYAFLFRDRDHHCLQVIWKETGRKDVWLALPGVGTVTAIDIDGRRSELDAGGQGLILTVNNDPLLLLYDSATAPLADTLGDAPVQVPALPEGIVKGGSVNLGVVVHGRSEQDVELVAPPLWTVARAPAAPVAGAGPGDRTFDFAVTAPETSSARAGDLIVKVKNPDGGYGGELRARVAVSGRVALRLLPSPAWGDKPAGVRLILHNYAAEKQNVAWKLALTGETPMAKGRFGTAVAPTAYFAEAAEGTQTLEPRGTAEVLVPLAGVDPLNVLQVKASVTDSAGRIISRERPMGGFVAVPRAKSPIARDGTMNEADWKNAPAISLDQARQYYPMSARAAKWKGATGQSGTARFLWDDKYLYLGVQVTDDLFVNNKVDGDIWAGDGLQMMVDPARESVDKPGKYDLAMALTKRGPQAWCFLTADGRSPSGEAKDIVVAVKRASAERGDMTYVVAIPWTRLAPFQPAVGADLGLCLAINNDDGPGRDSHMNWFGDIESKQVDTVGDLLLGD
jgi:hypothetical protein